MRSMITAVCCVVLMFGVLSAQDMAKKDTSKQEEMKMSKGMSMDEKDCPHCTKDKKCPMHAKKGTMKKGGMKKEEMKKEEGTKK